MKRIRLTLAQAVVRFLDQQYISLDGREIKFIEGIWGIFGHGCVVGIGEALARNDHGLKFYQGHNEQGMAHAAIAFAKQQRRQKIIAAMSSIGPGSTNLITAAATATINRIPLLLLPGDIFACRQPDPVLQQLEQENNLSISVNDCFKPVCKFWDRIVRPEQFISSGLHAMRVLTDPAETGSVCLSLAQDVQGESYDYPVGFFDKRVHLIRRPMISDEEITQIVKLMMNKKKPLLIAGGGVVYSQAESELTRLAETFNLPMAETQAGKGYLQWDHPLNLGTLGVTGTLAANRAAKKSDLVIGIGTRFNDFTTASKSAFSNPDCDFISINLNPFDAYKMMGYPVIGDAKSAINQITEELSRQNYRSLFGDETKPDLDEWKQEVDRLYQTKLQDQYSQLRVLGQLNQDLIPSNSVIVSASGSLPADLGRLWRTKSSGGYHLEYGYSCMGYEVAGALGVKMAQPHREVYALVGDGSYILMHSELFTSIQEGLKINIVLFDNNGFHCIDNLQTSQGIPSYGCEFRYRNQDTGKLDGAYLPVDYAANARSYGAQAWTVHNQEELIQAFDASRKSPVSTLIDIKVGHKTMSDGYESWWRVGTPEISQNQKTLTLSRELISKKNSLRDF